MKRLIIVIIATAYLCNLPYIVYAAGPYCQSVNSHGINYAPKLAKSMNKLLAAKGAKYRTSAKEINKVIIGYCAKNPFATEDEAIQFLNIMADTVAAGEKMK